MDYVGKFSLFIQFLKYLCPGSLSKICVFFFSLASYFWSWGETRCVLCCRVGSPQCWVCCLFWPVSPPRHICSEWQFELPWTSCQPLTPLISEAFPFTELALCLAFVWRQLQWLLIWKCKKQKTNVSETLRIAEMSLNLSWCYFYLYHLPGLFDAVKTPVKLFFLDIFHIHPTHKQVQTVLTPNL